MTQPPLIPRIEQLLEIELQAAPLRPHDPFGGLMAYKQGIAKYQADGDRLTGLNLANTGLTDVQWAAILNLPGFQPGDLAALNVSDNQLQEFRLPAAMRNLKILNLDDNPLTFPPPEVLSQGHAAILRFLKELQTQGAREVYEVKLLIVGEGETGKTTLWHKLQDPDYPVPQPPEQQPSTVGIEIREGWTFPHPQLPDTPFLVNLWDFGGQEIQYMTHQFFLTRRSFYVLLADGRREVANFAYWFKIIHLLGCDVEAKHPLPVLVVLNEKGNPIAKMPYDPEEVKTTYPGLEIIRREVDFAKRDGRLTGLIEGIKKTLADPEKMPHLPLVIPAFWEGVRQVLKDLRAAGTNHINLERYQQICRDQGIGDELQMWDLSRMLHDLGVILHYLDDINLSDFVVLNPQWAVNAVYEVLRHEAVAQNQGRFTKQFLENVLTQKRYSLPERRQLTHLMLKDSFEVCFPAEEAGLSIFIAPQLLPKVREAFDWDAAPQALRYIYQYPFMPKGLIGRLIVRLHEKIESQNQRKVVWEKGMVLADSGCRALVQETEDKATGGKIIHIEVAGAEPEDRRYLLRDIRGELDRIHKRSFPALRFEEKIPCCCALCLESGDPDFHALSDLEGRKAKGRKSIECNKSYEQVSIRALMEGVYGEEMRGMERSTVRDLIEKDRLAEALKEIQARLPADRQSEATQLLSQLSALEKKERLGNIGHQEALTERSQIRAAVLVLCDFLE